MANFMPGEWDLQKAESERRRRFADQLMNTQQPQGGMVGNVYVAPSWTQQLATVLNKWQGGQMMRDADRKEREVFDAQQQKYKTASERLADALRAKVTPAVDGNNTDDAAFMNAPGMYQPEQRVIPTADDQMAALARYYGEIGDPNGTANLAMFGLQRGLNRQDKLEDRKYNRDTQLEDRAYAEGREEKLYNRNREDKLEDVSSDREFQRLMEKERQGFQLTQQERQFVQQKTLQAQSQAFQAGENAKSRAAQRDNEPLVTVLGADGKAVYTPRSQAVGKPAYSAKQEAADTARVQQQEQARISAQQVLDQAETLFKHPGRGAGTGLSSFMSKVPGTDARGFQANLDTFKAQTFVPMVSALKGMGALSDAEGKKLADSVGALDPSMPEAEFEKSLQNITRTLYDKAKASGLNVSMPAFAAKKEAKPKNITVDY
jgi:hypothetical protein